MHTQRIISILILLLFISCGKTPGPAGEGPVKEQDQEQEYKDTLISLEQYNYYCKSTHVAQETVTNIRFNRAGSRPISETRGLLTYNDEGLKSLQETYTDGKLSLRTSYTYGDHSMHQRTERPGDTPYETEYTYEDAERTRVLEEKTTLPEATGSNEGYYQRTAYVWSNNRNTTQETYVYMPAYFSSEILTQRVEKEYSRQGRVFGEITYTTKTGAFGQQASETFRSETTTYRDTSLTQPEKVVIYVNEASPVTTHIYTYNKDNLPIKREVYSDDKLYSFSAYTYKDNVRTVYTYMPLSMQVTETTFLDSHSYTSQEDPAPSPFEVPSLQGEEDYSAAIVTNYSTDWEPTPIYLHNSLTGAASSFCFSLKNVSNQELTLISNSRSRCSLTPIGSNGSSAYGNMQFSAESVAPGTESECSFKVGFPASTVYEMMNVSVNFEYKAGTETRTASFYIQNMPVFDTLD